MKRQISFIILCIILGSCHRNSPINKTIQSGQSDRAIQKAKLHDIHQEKEIRINILKLTSPKFFEYTQAARNIIKIGPKAIPSLYRSRHLVRESNNALVPVCMLLIKIIIQNQKTGKVKTFLKSPFEEIHKIADEELQRRKKEAALQNKKKGTAKQPGA